MKKLFFLVIVVLFSLNIYSQWGVKGGVNYSTMTDSSIREYMFSGHIGGTYEHQLSDKWYLQPELLFTSIGYNLGNDGLVIKGGHVKIYALELPVNFSFRPMVSKNTNMIVDMGLYIRYGLFGNKTYEFHEYQDIPNVDESPFDAYNRFDTGLNLGLGLQKHQYYGILSFQRGLSRAEKNINTFNQTFRLSLGYRF